MVLDDFRRLYRVKLACRAHRLTQGATSYLYRQLKEAIPDADRGRVLINTFADVQSEGRVTAGRIGFYLGVSLVSHGALGDRAWLAEAMRLAGVAHEVTSPT